MRPIETLLLLANLLTFCGLALPLPQAMLWLRYAALIALLIAVAQVLVEGARWQMIPAYALTGIFFLIWLLPKITRVNWATNRFVIGLTVGLGVLALALAIALPIILPVFHFPQPSGPYAIGTLTYHWIDTSRHEIFSTDPHARRELMVQIWYPAQANASAPRAPYMQDARALSPALARLAHWPGFVFEYLQYVTTHAAASVPVAPDQPNYPLLIFLEGLSGFRQMNTFQVEALVSHGYIVAAIDQPYAAASVVFPDGR